MHETTTGVMSAGLKLEGTWCRPATDGRDAGAHVLLIGGSGALDRDGNGARAKLHLFDALARQLAAGGVTTLRYDKRGCGVSEGRYRDTGHADLVADAIAWYDHLVDGGRGTASGTYVLGLSEGTLICPQVIAARSDVDGQILVAPFLSRLEDVIRRQAEIMVAELAVIRGWKGSLTRLLVRVSGDPLAKQKRLLARVRASDETSFGKVNAAWIRELDAIDPEAVHRAVSPPTLIIAGGKDLQCAPEEAERLHEIAADTSELVLLPDLMHLMRREPGTPSFARYKALIAEPIDPRVGEAILTWLGRRDGAPGRDATLETD